jgi:hypothetical protein
MPFHYPMNSSHGRLKVEFSLNTGLGLSAISLRLRDEAENASDFRRLGRL